MSVVNDSLNYSPYVYTHGSYQLSRIVQQNGGQTVTVTPQGGQESIFELPAKVFNLGKSNLSFTVTPAAGPANNYNVLFVDGVTFFRQVQLYTRSGLYLCDINDFDRYTNITVRRENKIEDMLTWDKIDGIFSGLTASNTSAIGNRRPAVGVNNVAGPANTQFLEGLYLDSGSAVAAANPVLNVQIDFDKLKNTILGLDKDLYFNGEILYLRIVWNPTTKILVNTTVVDNTMANGNSAAATTNVTVSNLLYYLAIEINPEIENMIKNKCNSAEGLQLLMPYVYYYKTNLGPATTQSVTLRYNRAHGLKLQKIYWAAYNTVEASLTAFDKNNIAAAKVVSFYTQMDNIRTSQYDYYCANYDDYKTKEDSLRGSCILSSNEYYYNWVWIEDFTDNNPKWKQLSVPEENCIDGLDLINERKYDIMATTTNTQLNHYVYTVCQKQLTISPTTGIVLM